MSSKIGFSPAALTAGSRQLGMDLRKLTEGQRAQLDLDHSGRIESGEVKVVAQVAGLGGTAFVSDAQKQAAAQKLLGGPSVPWDSDSLAQVTWSRPTTRSARRCRRSIGSGSCGRPGSTRRSPRSSWRSGAPTRRWTRLESSSRGSTSPTRA